MFTCEKFSRLAETARLRYLWRWLKDAETSLSRGQKPETLITQLNVLGPFLVKQEAGFWRLAAELPALMVSLGDPETFLALGRRINQLHHALAGQIGQEAAEWDLREGLWRGDTGVDGRGDTDGTGLATQDSGPGRSHGACRRIYLDDLRSPFNVGSIFRTAEVFGFDEIILSPECPALDHPRLERSAMGCIHRVAHRRMTFAELVSDVPGSEPGGQAESGFFALELGGTGLAEFCFPAHGIVVLGNEELGVNPEILDYCTASAGRVSIPMKGSKASLNVAVSFGILAHAWAFA